jgi:hypothetical protein
MKFAGRVMAAVSLIVGSLMLSAPSAHAVGPTTGPWKVEQLAGFPSTELGVPGASSVQVVVTNEFKLDIDLNGDGDKRDAAAQIRRGGVRGLPFAASFMNLADQFGSGRFMWAKERPGVDLDGNGRSDQQGYFWLAGDGPWTFIRSGRPFVGPNDFSENVVVFGDSGGIAVTEAEVDLGVDFDGDGVGVGDGAVTMIAAGGRVVSMQTATVGGGRPFVRALGDGWIGGSLLVRPDGTSRKIADDSSIVAHFGDAGLYMAIGYMGSRGPLILERPGQASITFSSGDAQLVTQESGGVWLSISDQANGQNTNLDGTPIPRQLCKLEASGSLMCLPISHYPFSPTEPATALGGGWLFVYGSKPSAMGNREWRHFLVSPNGIEAEYAGALLAPLGADRFALVVDRPPAVGESLQSVELLLIDHHVVSGPIWRRSSYTRYGIGITGLGDGRGFFSINEGTGYAPPGFSPDPNASDLNGNGHDGDYVTFLLTGSTLRNLRGHVDLSYHLTGYSFAVPVPGGPVFVGMIEGSIDADLNGDNDKTDIVAHVIDETGLANLGVAIGSSFDPSESFIIKALGPDRVLLPTNEWWQHADLNGDGTIDSAMAAFEVSRRQVVASGVLAPSRLLDTRSGAVPAAGSTTVVDVAGNGGVPASGVRSVALNVTATGALGPGFVTVWGDGERPGTSNLNIEYAGQTVPNLVVVPVGADGKVRLFTDSGTHLIVDIAGWWGAGSGLVPLTPSRLLDSRGASKRPAGTVTEVQIAGRGGAPASGAMVAVVNVTMTDTDDAGFVTVWGQGTQPPTSNLNATQAGQTVPNLVIVPVGSDGKIRLFTSVASHLLVDITGVFTSGVSVGEAVRVRDTRSSVRPLAGSTIVVPMSVPAGTKAVILNVTATEATGPGFVTVWPDGAMPTASNLNLEYEGQTVPNLVIVPVGADGNVRLFISTESHLIVDRLGVLQ